MNNCSDPNNPCTQRGLPCEACPPCSGCVEPEVLVIRRLPQLDDCAPVIDAIKEIVGAGGGGPVAGPCTVKISSITVLGKSVTINVEGSTANLEFSADNISYQSSPTFNNRPCGENKYYARQKNSPACIDAKYATVSQDCECVPDWKPTNPPVPDCRDGYVAIKLEDGCGNVDWQMTSTPCGGGCDETYNDVNPPVTDCVDGKVRYLQRNGCDQTRFRTSSENCNTCSQPSLPTNAQLTPATCNTSGQILANGAFTLGPINGGNRYGLYPGTTYNGPGYDIAAGIPGNGYITVTGLQGQSYSNSYVVRIFNGSNNCFVDKVITFDPVNCQSQCVIPSFTFSSTPPSCNGNASNNDGILHFSNYANVTRIQICVGSSFVCTPNYNTATPVSGSGPINIVQNLGFTAQEQYRDYTVRAYNGSQGCYSDATFRYMNPCYSSGSCTTPGNSTPTASQATCTGSVLNNNASILITNITNANKYGFSTGSTYSGPNYANGLPVGGSQINLTGLVGSQNSTTYTIRLYNGSEECIKDIVVTIPGKVCDVPCTTPTYGSKSGNAATCTSSVINSDASIAITGITGMTRYGVSNGNSYSGPNYSGAFASVATSINLTNLPGSASIQTKTIRIFNGSDSCYLDVVQTIPATSCAPSCTNPTFNISSTPPTQCVGEQSSADGKVTISSIANGTKWQICIAPTFNCTPNFAGSPVISGAGPIEVANYIGFSAGETSKTIVVRVYNANESCYTDHSVVMQNPCISCCGMTINNVQLTNV